VTDIADQRAAVFREDELVFGTEQYADMVTPTRARPWSISATTREETSVGTPVRGRDDGPVCAKWVCRSEARANAQAAA
jgi:hypothetical protein